MANFFNFGQYFNFMYYEKLPKGFIQNVIKTGTFCRTMLPIFIPLTLYQYIRQTDKDRYAEELFYEYAKNQLEKDASWKGFFDPSMNNSSKNWRVQYDLYLIDKAVNS